MKGSLLYPTLLEKKSFLGYVKEGFQEWSVLEPFRRFLGCLKIENPFEGFLDI